MITPLWKDSDIEEFFSYFEEEANEKIVMMLTAAGEKYVEVARKSGSYQDHTGNLRASIGYVIIYQDDIIKESFVKPDGGTDGETGIIEARRLAKDVASEIGTDYVLVNTAGMNYAAAVEATGRDVATTGAQYSEKYLRKTSKILFDKIRKR